MFHLSLAHGYTCSAHLRATFMRHLIRSPEHQGRRFREAFF
jgi:hypothetical protein